MSKILMVEEKIGTAQRIQERLSLAGFETFSAYDGRHALQMARDKAPDLIITDAVIPILNGYEFCKAIKRDVETKSIPIVVMTEKHRMEESFKFLGVKDFLNKPFSMDELESIVRHKLNVFDMLQLQKTEILISGRPEILSCCQQLFKRAPSWLGHFSDNGDSLIEDAIKYVPDVILIDLLMTDVSADELILKLKAVPTLKNTVILTYYTTALASRDHHYAMQAQMIEVQYMKIITQVVGAREFLGAFNPVTFLNLINIYRKDFDV